MNTMLVTKNDLPQPSVMVKFKGIDDCISKIAQTQVRHEYKDISGEDAKIQLFACGLYVKALFLKEQLRRSKAIKVEYNADAD